MALPTSSSLDYGILLCADQATANTMRGQFASILTEHHLKFLRPNAQPWASRCSIGGDVEMDPIDAPCFILSFDKNKSPCQGALGYSFGIGDRFVDEDTFGVDFLMPTQAINPIQGYIGSNKTTSQLCITAWNRGVAFNGQSLSRNGQRALGYRENITIGPLKFTFQYIVQDENLINAKKQELLERIAPGFEVPMCVSQTPMRNATWVGDWLLHGVIGSTASTRIKAATNREGNKLLAVKCLRSVTDRHEVRKYQEILADIKDHDYSQFVMSLYDTLEGDRANLPGLDSEVHLLLQPLALGDWTQFIDDKDMDWKGRWTSVTVEVKQQLFVQALLGLQALHKSGWIHRDIKPANLGVVRLGDRPRAVILDLGHAVRHSDEGLIPVPNSCGTLGYLAPELEHRAFSPTGNYGYEVDVWSLGATGQALFMGKNWPQCLYKHRLIQNPWLHSHSRIDNAITEMANRPPRSCLAMLGRMLATYSEDRSTIDEVLREGFLQWVRERVDAMIVEEQRLLEETDPQGPSAHVVPMSQPQPLWPSQNRNFWQTQGGANA